MVTVRKYANNITQSSGVYQGGSNPRQYRTFTNLSALKADDGNYAQCNNLGGKNGTWNRPSTLYFKNFGFNIPSYAKITKIVVGYAHNKITYSSSTAYPSINAPLITLLNVSGCSERGYAVPVNYTRFTKTYEVFPTPSLVNSSNFGVSIDYPTNTNTNPGAMKVGYCWIEITYDDLNFAINSSIVKEKGKYFVDDTVDIQVDLANLSNARVDYDATVNISLPSGVSFVQKVSGSGDFNTINQNTVNWISNMNSNFESSVVLRIRCTSQGTKTITFTESSTQIQTKITIKVEEDTIQLIVNVPEHTVEDGVFPLEIVAKTNVPRETNEKVYFSLPDQLIIQSFYVDETLNKNFTDKGQGEYEWEPDVSVTGQDECIAYVSATSPGLYTYYVGTSSPLTENDSYTIKIRPKELTSPFFSSITVNDEVRSRMESGITYTLSSFMKMDILEEDIELIEEYSYNYRMGVFNSPIPENEEDFTEEYILSNCIFSEALTEPNILTERSLEFIFNAENPLIVVFTGEYIEVEARAFGIEFSNPIIAETAYYEGVEEPGLFPSPFKSLIRNDDFAVTELDSLKETNRIRIYDYQMGGIETRDNIVIQGLEVHFTVNTNNSCSLLLKVLAPNGAVGERSINIDEGTREIIIGGQFDLHGLTFEDYRDLDYLELELVELNPFHHDTYLEINNIYLTFHYLTIPDYVIKAFVNGIDCRYYNMFITNVEIPAGTENDVQYVQVDGTDSNLPYRSNIQEKEITITFQVIGCNLEETSMFLERIGNLFRNKRDEFNRPTMNTIEFSHYPNRVWKYIIEESIEAEAEISDYEGEIKLIIPDGTSFAKEMLVTNAQGTNQGIAKVNPVIQIMPMAEEITITETVSGQNMIIRDEELDSSDIVIIDCANRIVQRADTDNEGKITYTDITEKIDFNSQWFLLEGEYRFTCNETANIQSISFYERW